MPHRPGARSSILAIALAWLAFTAAQLVTAQVLLRGDEHPDHAPCATEPQPGDGSWCYPKGPEIHVIVREPLAEAIGRIGSDERRYQEEIRAGKNLQPERTPYAKWMLLNDAEDDVIRAIMLDAYTRLTGLWPEIAKEGLELQHHYSDDLAEKRFTLIAQLQPIYDGVEQKLHDNVGDAAVGRLKRYFLNDKRKTETRVYYYRRPYESVYLGELPNPNEAMPAVTHE